MRIVVDMGAGTAEFYVNDRKHKQTAEGISGPVRGFFYSYSGSSSNYLKARVTAVPAARTDDTAAND